MSERVYRTDVTDTEPGDSPELQRLKLDAKFKAERADELEAAWKNGTAGSTPRRDASTPLERARQAYKQDAPAIGTAPTEHSAKPAIKENDRNDSTPDPLARAKAASTRKGEFSK